MTEYSSQPIRQQIIPTDMNQIRTAIWERVESVSAATFSRTEIAVYLGALMLCVLSLSLFVFSGQSLRLDESQSLWQTSHSPITMVNIVAEDVHVPLYHIILHYWQIPFGNGEAAARALSLSFFLLLIPAMYLFGKQAFGSVVGMYAALLAALSPFLNWYGNEIRMYSLFALLIVLNQYFFLRIYANGTRKPVRTLIWVGYGATMMLGIFTHYFFLFNAVTQAIYFFAFHRSFARNAGRGFVIVMLVLLVIFTPWLYFVIDLGAAGNTQPILSKPTPVDLFNTFFEFAFGFQSDRTNTTFISLWPLLVLFMFLALRRNQKIPPIALYLFMSLFLPVIFAYGISSGWKPIYLTRYLILALPAFYVLISWVLSSYPPKLSRLFKSALVLGMAAMLTVQIVNAGSPVKEDYRGASAYIAENATARDIVILSAPFTIYPFEYYYNGAAEVETLPIWDRNQAGQIPAWTEERMISDIETLKGAHEKIWLLLSYDQGYEEQVRLYFDTHFERVDSKNFSPGMNLYAYRLRYDTQTLDQALRYLDQAGI